MVAETRRVRSRRKPHDSRASLAGSAQFAHARETFPRPNAGLRLGRMSASHRNRSQHWRSSRAGDKLQQIAYETPDMVPNDTIYFKNPAVSSSSGVRRCHRRRYFFARYTCGSVMTIARLSVVGIGASAGGIEAFRQILRDYAGGQRAGLCRRPPSGRGPQKHAAGNPGALDRHAGFRSARRRGRFSQYGAGRSPRHCRVTQRRSSRFAAASARMNPDRPRR